MVQEVFRAMVAFALYHKVGLREKGKHFCVGKSYDKGTEVRKNQACLEEDSLVIQLVYGGYFELRVLEFRR